jgi:hypothetical protein
MVFGALRISKICLYHPRASHTQLLNLASYCLFEKVFINTSMLNLSLNMPLQHIFLRAYRPLIGGLHCQDFSKLAWTMPRYIERGWVVRVGFSPSESGILYLSES